MSLYDEILNDLTGTVDLSIVLRKAKVMSYKLKNKDFRDWIENEFNGYARNDMLPRHRIIDTIAQGNFFDGYRQFSNYSIPLENISKEYREAFNKIYLKQGIKELESLCETADRADGNTLRMSIPTALVRLLDYKVFEGMQCFDAWRLLSKSQVAQVVDSTRNKLLDFILELADEYPEIKSDADLTKPIPNEKIQQIFNYSIFGGKQNIIGSTDSVKQGDNMAIFDQRNQKVNTQYNAAGDINFNNVQDASQFIAELQKLKSEFARVAEEEAIDGEIITDTEYQLTKAIQHSQKNEPQRATIIEHLKNAKQLVDGVTATTTLITALTKAIEIAGTVFN